MVVLIAGIVVWQRWPVEKPAVTPAEPAAETTPAADEQADTGPRYPVPDPAPQQATRGELQPLPPLDESDEYFRMELRGLLDAASLDADFADALIERLVATIDNLPRAAVAERVRPLGPPASPFAAGGQDGSGEFTLGPDNYQRYDALVAAIASADLAQAADVYRRYYPLFQKAYVGLGYPQGYFNDRLVEVIDHLLATPEVSGSIALVRPHVLFEFADPDLEALSAGQKLMLRIGPAHRATLGARLREFRALIIAPQP